MTVPFPDDAPVFDIDHDVPAGSVPAWAGGEYQPRHVPLTTNMRQYLDVDGERQHRTDGAILGAFLRFGRPLCCRQIEAALGKGHSVISSRLTRMLEHGLLVSHHAGRDPQTNQTVRYLMPANWLYRHTWIDICARSFHPPFARMRKPRGWTNQQYLLYCVNQAVNLEVFEASPFFTLTQAVTTTGVDRHNPNRGRFSELGALGYVIPATKDIWAAKRDDLPARFDHRLVAQRRTSGSTWETYYYLARPLTSFVQKEGPQITQPPASTGPQYNLFSLE